MIQANELRIGNWVHDYFKINGHTCQINLDDFQVSHLIFIMEYSLKK